MTECGKEQDYKSNTAKRLTADTWASIKDNYYLCPTVERPYYYLSNCNPALDEVVVSGIPNNLGMDIVRADFRD